MGDLISLLGTTLVIGGVFVEFIAFAGMEFYPIRRALPFRSPLQLQATGCAVFYSGVLILVAVSILG